MFRTLRPITVFLALACLLAAGPSHEALAQGGMPDGQDAIDAFQDARDAVRDAEASGDSDAADDAREKFDEAKEEFEDGVESGEIGEYLEEVLERVLFDLEADLNKVELEHFQVVGPLGDAYEGFFSDDPIEDEPEDTFPKRKDPKVGTEYDAADVFRPDGNRNRYRVLPPGAWMPTPEPGRDAMIGVHDVLNAVRTLQSAQPEPTHVAPEPEPSLTAPGVEKTVNPCSNLE